MLDVRDDIGGQPRGYKRQLARRSMRLNTHQMNNFWPLFLKKYFQSTCYNELFRNLSQSSKFGRVFERGEGRSKKISKTPVYNVFFLEILPNLSKKFSKYPVYKDSGLALLTVNSEESLSTCLQWISLLNSGFGIIFEHFMTL